MIFKKLLSVKQTSLDIMHISLNLKGILVFSLLKNNKKKPSHPRKQGQLTDLIVARLFSCTGCVLGCWLTGSVCASWLSFWIWESLLMHQQLKLPFSLRFGLAMAGFLFLVIF